MGTTINIQNYVNESSLLSTAGAKLQNEWYQQPYSYSILSKQDLAAYKEVLKKTVHPAGMTLFGKKITEISANVSLESFRIAGGIILFLIAIEMLFNKRQERKEKILDQAKDKLSIFPLAIPLLAGPAAITSVIVIATKYQGDLILQSVSILGLVAVMLITLLFFLLLAKSDKFLKKNITNIISRVIAIILAALSIQYIIDGLLILFKV